MIVRGRASSFKFHYTPLHWIYTLYFPETNGHLHQLHEAGLAGDRLDGVGRITILPVAHAAICRILPELEFKTI